MKPFKSLSIPEQNAEVARIIAHCDTDTAMIGGAIKHVGEVLETDEILIAMVSGSVEWSVLAKRSINLGLGSPLPQLIALTDRRIAAVRKRVFGRADATSFRLDQIGEVTGRTGILESAIHIRMLGETRVIGSVRKGSVAPFVECAMNAIGASRSTLDDEVSPSASAEALSPPDYAEASPPTAVSSPAPPPGPEDVPEEASTSQIADELEKLASLMERGILTPEEFAHQKAKLLQG